MWLSFGGACTQLSSIKKLVGIRQQNIFSNRRMGLKRTAESLQGNRHFQLQSTSCLLRVFPFFFSWQALSHHSVIFIPINDRAIHIPCVWTIHQHFILSYILRRSDNAKHCERDFHKHKANLCAQFPAAGCLTFIMSLQ